MRCHRVRRLNEAFAEGQVTQEDRRAIEAHLAGCPTCVEDVARARRVRHLLRSTGELFLDPAEEALLQQRIRAATRAARFAPLQRRRRTGLKQGPRQALWRPALVGVAAVAVLVALILLNPFQQHPEPPELAVAGATDDLSFYFQEHALSENHLIFNQGELSGVLIAEGIDSR